MKFPPKIAYVAGPYRSDTVNGMHENIESARRVAVSLWQMGFDVFCPHTSSGMMDGIVPDARFLDFGLRMVPICDCVVLVDGWQWSGGTLKEVDRANELGKPIFHFSRDAQFILAFAKSLTWEQAQASGEAEVKCDNCGWTGAHGMLIKSELENENCPVCCSWRIETWRA